jgi:hypothetical protein
MGKTCTLFKITAIRLHLYCDSQSAGFDVYVTDEDHQLIKSFLNRDPEVNGWYDLDLTGWTGYVDTHFFVEFVALPPNPNLQESWAILWFDEAVIDEGEASYGRSYRYTYGPDNPNTPAWLPIELTYPYGPGDLMIRVELEPQTPETVLPSLIDAISAAEPEIFQGQASSVKATLIKKIGEAISMFEKGNYIAGLNKLEEDIAKKLADPRPTPLADPRPTPRTSWFRLYTEGSPNQKSVTAFAVECQGIIQMTQKSALPPSLLEHCDFDGDTYDDLAVGVPYENIGGKEDAGAVNVLYGSADGICNTADDYWHQDITGVKGKSGENDHFGEALAIGNFNGDGYDDLAIGVPGDEVDGVEIAGAVNVLYGSLSGLTADGDQLWHQNSEGIDGVCEAGDFFGASLAVGDFDGDGYDDLAIGTPLEDYAHPDDGAVTILYGSFDGLIPYGNQLWTQNSEGIIGECEEGDHFGAALAAGDFDGDGFDDLAVGAPTEGWSMQPNEPQLDQGVVNVLYGSSGGLSSLRNQLWGQDSLDNGESEWLDCFGDVLAVGDLNWDGYEDLIIGVPRESLFVSGQPNQQWAKIETGAVNIIYGSSIGLTAVGNQFIDEEWCEGEFADYDHFGASLAVGDFDADGYMDLAVGAPKKDVETYSGSLKEKAGAFYVIHGSSLGLEWSDKCRMWVGEDCPLGGEIEKWSVHLPNGGYSETDDYFGEALYAGDFDGDWCCDLAIGVPGKDVQYLDSKGWYQVIDDAGTVDVLYGSETGLWTVNGKTWHQDMAGIKGTCEDGDSFGGSLPGSYLYALWPSPPW